MEPTSSEQTWGIITIAVSVAVGLVIALILVGIVNSRRVKQSFRLAALLIGFTAYLLWLFTMGDPRSDVSLESMYHRYLAQYVPAPAAGEAATNGPPARPRK